MTLEMVCHDLQAMLTDWCSGRPGQPPIELKGGIRFSIDGAVDQDTLRTYANLLTELADELDKEQDGVIQFRDGAWQIGDLDPAVPLPEIDDDHEDDTS
jgi:hypothetical protein